MRSVWRGLIYVGSFGAARGALFAAPIFIANAVPAGVYGELEYAQAVASTLALTLAAGTGAAVPISIVQGSARYSWPALVMHQALTGISLLTVALVLFVAGVPVVGWAVCVTAAVLMLQAFWSAYLKSVSHLETALLLEAGFWIVAATAALCAWLAAVPGEARGLWLWAAVSGYCFLLVTWTVFRLAGSVTHAIERYRETLRAALPLLLTALLSVLVTTSGRLATGFLTTPEITADYAILFRATAIPIVAHQILIVAKFRQVFEASVQELERQLIIVVGLVTASIIVCWALLEAAAPIFGSAFVRALAKHPQEAALILMQCGLWSAIAINDLVNGRAMTAGRAARWTSSYIAMLLIGSWIALELGAQVTLESFVPVHSTMMLGFYLTQSAAMARAGIKLGATWALSAGSFVVLSLCTYLVVQP